MSTQPEPPSPLPWPTPDPAPARLTHEPALDGLRGLAVAGVVLYHLALLDTLVGLGKVTKGGFLGVSAFFTLSGFLITSLLLLESRRDGHISFRRFWSRRARRLLPAALTTLAAVAVLARWLAAPDQLEHLRAEVLSAVGYVANWRFIFSGSDYAALFTAQSPLKHLWSLSIEEQWYLIVPLLVAFTLRVRRGRRDLLAAVLGAGLVGTVALGWWLDHGVYANRVYLGTDTRFPELAVGALLAVAIAGRPVLRLGAVTRARRAGRAALDLGSAVVAIALVAVWATTDLQATWLYRGGFALHAVGIAIIIAAAMRPGTVVNRVFRWRPIAALGRISYGVYLFHWPIILWLTPARLHMGPVAAAIAQTAATLALATVSYLLIESPIRSGRMVIDWRRLAMPAAAIAAVVVLALVLPTPDRSLLTAPLVASRRIVTRVTVPKSAEAPPSSVERSRPGTGTTIDAAPTTTVPPAPVRVMIIGDSFSLSVFAGLARAATAQGQIAVLNEAIIGCGFGRGGLNRGLNISIPYTPECKRRDQTLTAAVASFTPQVVLLAGSLWDVSNRKPPGARTWEHIGQPAYDSYLGGELAHLADVVQSHGAQIVWLASPHWRPVYKPGSFMAPGPYAEADPARVDRFNQLLTTTLAGRPRTQIIDLPAWLATQPGGEFGPTVRNDGVHLTQTESDVAAVWLVPQLVAIGRASPAG